MLLQQGSASGGPGPFVEKVGVRIALVADPDPDRPTFAGEDRRARETEIARPLEDQVGGTNRDDLPCRAKRPVTGGRGDQRQHISGLQPSLERRQRQSRLDSVRD